MNVFRATLVIPLVLDADHCAFLTGLLTSKSFWVSSALKCSLCRWCLCNNISVDRSKNFVYNQKIVVLDNFFSCLQTIDLATLYLLPTAPPTQTAFQSWTNSKRLWSQQPWFLTVNASQIKLALIKNVLLPVNRVISVEAMLDVQSLTTSPSVTANQTTLETLSKLALKYVCDIFTQFA